MRASGGRLPRSAGSTSPLRPLEVSEHPEPRSHIVCDNFLQPAAHRHCLEAVLASERHFRVGRLITPTSRETKRAVETNHKRNRVVLLTDSEMLAMRDRFHLSSLPQRFRTSLYRASVLLPLRLAREGLFQLVERSCFDTVQVSAYGDGDYYLEHLDQGENLNLTVLLFLCAEPKRFRGGDLALRFRGQERLVRFRNNRLVIFPANTPHRVTAVQSAHHRFRDCRFSLQVWPRLGDSPETVQGSGLTAARRRPTAKPASAI